MALPKDTSSVNARSLSKDFESKGREGYYEAAAKAEDSAPDLGNIFNAIKQGGLTAQIAIKQETELAMQSGNSSVAAAFSAAQGGLSTQKELQKKRAEDAKLMAHLALLDSLNNRIADLEGQLGNIRADIQLADRSIGRMEDGTFDPANDKQDAEYLAALLERHDMTSEQWDALSQGEQMELMTQDRDELVQKADDLEVVIDAAREDLRILEDAKASPETLLSDVIPNALEKYKVVNGQFENKLLEQAAQKWESEHKGQSFDRSNMRVSDLENLLSFTQVDAFINDQNVRKSDAELGTEEQSKYTENKNTYESQLTTFG